MTLICCSQIELDGQEGILLATDSMLSGAGIRVLEGPKLFPVTSRGDCAFAFEGTTDLAYPFLINVLTFVQYSEHLQNAGETDCYERRLKSAAPGGLPMVG